MSRGFTLVELVAVIVLLGIVAGIGSRFVLSTMDAYQQATDRNTLVARSQSLAERMIRQLRLALPYSLRVSPSGNCIEFMQISGGANYLGILPDSKNGAPATSVINSAAFELSLGAARHAAVGAMAAAEIYTTASPASRVGVAAVNGPPITQVTLSTPHQFIRNSINERLYLADDPARFCLLGSQLWHYSGYGLDTAPLTDANPGGSAVLMSDDVVPGNPGFALSGATETRSALVQVQFGVRKNDEVIAVNQQVQIRNVP